MGDHRFTTSATARVMYSTLCDENWRWLGTFVGIQKVLNGQLVIVGEVGGEESLRNRKTPSCCRKSVDGAAGVYRARSGGTIPEKHIKASEVNGSVQTAKHTFERCRCRDTGILTDDSGSGS